jgi:hypothetical protein
VLIEHRVGGEITHLMIDVENPEASENITDIFALNLREPILEDKNDRVILARVDDSLHRFDLGSKTVSRALVRNTQQFVFDKDLLVTINPNSDGKLVVNLIQGDKAVEFLLLEGEASNYQVDTAVYDGDRYLVLVNKSAGLTNIYRDPLKLAESEEEPSSLATLRLNNVESLSFSPHSQFVMIQAGNDFRLYDLDDEAKRAFSSPLELSPGALATWVDGYHLNLIDKTGGSYFMDYDGTNSHKINTIAPEFGVFYDSSGENMLSFSTGGAGNQILQVSSLVAEES